MVFGETILVIFDHSKWFENGLENSLKNGLTLQISRWYKWLRFKDIIQGFEKLKKKWLKKLEWNGMVWRIEKSEKTEWNGMGRMVGANGGQSNKGFMERKLSRLFG